jgi:hypothetical protein
VGGSLASGRCRPACLLACLPACLLACLPACLLACLPACLLACLPAGCCRFVWLASGRCLLPGVFWTGLGWWGLCCVRGCARLAAANEAELELFRIFRFHFFSYFYLLSPFHVVAFLILVHSMLGLLA